MENVIVSLINGSYSFKLDYGLDENPSLIINQNNFVSVFLNEYDYDKDYEKRRNDILKKILIPMFGKSVAINIINEGTLKVKDAFMKADQYIINNDLFVGINDSLEKSINKPGLAKKEYVYRCIHDKETNSVSYYIKSKLKNDGEFGIKILEDDSFFPIYSTKTMESNISKELKNIRETFLKSFVKEVLGKTINFGTILGGKSIKIKDLNLIAIKDSKIKNDVKTYFDEDNIFEYNGPIV